LLKLLFNEIAKGCSLRLLKGGGGGGEEENNPPL
jgi:hypothetical protein